MKSQKINFRLATSADFEFAKKVHHSGYYDVVVKQFGKWDENLQNSFFEKDWNNGNGFKIIIYNDIPCGYSSFIEIDNNTLLAKELVILPEFQGKGVGTQILKNLLKKATQEGKIIRGEVLKENKAKELYQKLGFIITGSNETHFFIEFDPISQK